MVSQRPQKQSNTEHNNRQEKLAYATWLEYGLVALSCVWLALVGVEFVVGERRDTTIALYAIWAVFVVEFLVRLLMAPEKLAYLRANALTVLSLLLPILRVLRLARLLRITRATRLLKVAGSINRATRSLARTLRHRGLPYVALLTATVTLLGAAAFTAFESPPDGHINGYADALWFTAMIMTTMGSSYWPASPEGRILCFILSLYAFAVFGYFTAALASFFIGDRQHLPSENQALHHELNQIKDQLARLTEKIESSAK